MKTRLQSLWDEVSPEGGPCPQPSRKAVRRRVDASLDQKPRALHPWRAVRLAALCAAALLLLTGAAAVVEVLAPPEYNVLTAFFRGDTAPWEDLMDFQPVSVSDGNYTLTLTSTVADKSTLFYTFTVEAKSDEAWAQLRKQVNESYYDLWSFRPGSSLSMSGGKEDAQARTLSLNVNTARGWTTNAAIRLNLMEKGKWLSFSYRPVSDVRLTIDAEGQGSAPRSWPSPAREPVTLKRLTLSPLTLQAEYITGNRDIFPMLYFLWDDGAVSDVHSLLGGSGHGSGRGAAGESMQYTQAFSFRSVQNLSQLKAVIFENTAYPLDGGSPYAVDVDALPRRGAEP